MGHKHIFNITVCGSLLLMMACGGGEGISEEGKVRKVLEYWNKEKKENPKQVVEVDKEREGGDTLRRYYKGGSLYYKVPLKDGKRHGMAKVYNKDGTLNFKAEYKKGEAGGLNIYYYDEGGVFAKGKKNKQGREEGEWKYYDQEGQLEEIEYYENGKLIRTEKVEGNAKANSTF